MGIGPSARTVDSSHPIHAQPASPLSDKSPPPGEASTEGPRAPAGTAELLADRIAAALVHREPGWRLPRRSALAKRHDVSLGEIDTAIDDLARRSLVRRLPDGQLYRASPAEHWIPIEGVGRLGTRLDPMGNTINCQTRHVSRDEPPQDVAAALGLPAGATVHIVRCVWSAAGDPVAMSTAYLHEPTADEDTSPGQDPEFPLFGSALNATPTTAVTVEVSPLRASPSQAAAAQTLRLAPGQPVITVTVRFDDSVTRALGGLTVVILRPELFRVAIDTAEAPVIAPLSSGTDARLTGSRPVLRRACPCSRSVYRADRTGALTAFLPAGHAEGAVLRSGRPCSGRRRERPSARCGGVDLRLVLQIEHATSVFRT
jgi:DNA-binding GntR family transcriptional regulator